MSIFTLNLYFQVLLMMNLYLKNFRSKGHILSLFGDFKQSQWRKRVTVYQVVGGEQISQTQGRSSIEVISVNGKELESGKVEEFAQ